MKIQITTKKVAIAILALQCIPPLFFIKYIPHFSSDGDKYIHGTGLQSLYGFYGGLILIGLGIFSIAKTILFIVDILEGDIELFKPFNLDFQRGVITQKQEKIDNYLRILGKAAIEGDENTEQFYYQKLKELNYFE